MRSAHSTRRSFQVAVALVGAFAGGTVCPHRAAAQSPESEAAPARGKFEPESLPPPPQPFVIPDVPHSVEQQLHVHEPWVTLKAGLATLEDYSAFSQDSNNLAQVGRQDNQWELRSLRLILHGTLGTGYKVRYYVAGEYKGFETEPENLWNMTDVSLIFPIAGPATTLTVGKTKETFGYEMVGDAANLPQQERVLTPFFVSRNIGLKLTHVIGATHRMTASVGVFNDWFVTSDALDESGTDVTARVTALAWDNHDGRSYLHLGVSGRYAGADHHTMRYKGRPESNVTDLYVDTGDLPGDHAEHLGLEALWNEKSFSALAEYHHAWLDAPTEDNPAFSGYYVTASWVLTGETRPYDRTVGYARRVMPKGRWGAPELVARFSHVDLDGGLVRGGSFDKTYLAINWWATRHWKFGLGWGYTWLHRFDQSGVTNSIHTRMQWIF
ncbi:MAG TPA: porin [Gemmatimonadales bacterium]|nr:porin [Gemmatimonadales bacterium]